MTARGSKSAVYLILLAIQVLGVIVFVWQELPAFTHVLLYPGLQVSSETHSELVVALVLFTMQIAYWVRLRYVPVPALLANAFLSHLFLFLGRLSFVFGSALFSVVLFRHVPEITGEADVLLIVRRGLILVASLFALFCASLEIERVGVAFNKPQV
ncbi:MAG: hypothetical protein JWR89_3797 [Tardiphaga sp.]|uniref:hypothetical protein n=1 Tax=Tardiphaga sp. TaxID=1926292 RepID=UPI00261EEC5F|nr:hypothetical protein [Tardiphaga sp.]MDB5503895.1 hypothetical protein [Tardiphaga sp.]